MLKRGKLAVAITLTTTAVAMSASDSFAHYRGGYYGGGAYVLATPYATYPGPYSGYVGVPGPYGAFVTSNVAYSYGGYGYGYGRQYGGPFSGPFRTDAAPGSGGGN
jgi:hypothetical protein